MELCCNCAALTGLTLLDQDTRLTRFFLMGGSEITFRLRLPFCRSCAPSAKRRPISLFHRLLVFGLFYFGVFAVLLLTGMALESESLLDRTGLLSGILGLVATVLWYAVRRPNPHQSSYYQPVRITRLRQKFFSGMVRGIGFAFTSAVYRQQFESINETAIAAGQIQSKQL